MATKSSALATGSNFVSVEQPNHEVPVAMSPSKSAKGKSQLKGRKIKRKDVNKRIKQLEKNLKTWHNMITKFQESELSFDDMDDEDSPYIRTDYIMQKFVRDWESLCSLTGCSSQILVDTCEQPKPYLGTPHLVLNKKVQRMVNSDIFPDYHDVVEMIEHYKKKHSLPIAEEHVSTLAQTVFSDIGKQIKRRRRYDFLHHFGCHLTDVVQMEEDPSLSSPSLQDQLDKSSQEAQARLLSLIDEFAHRQDSRERDGVKEEGEEEEESEEDDGNDSEHDKISSRKLSTDRDSEEEEAEEQADEDEVDHRAEEDGGELNGEDGETSGCSERGSPSLLDQGSPLRLPPSCAPHSTEEGGQQLLRAEESDSEGSLSEFLDTVPLKGLLIQQEGVAVSQQEDQGPTRSTPAAAGEKEEESRLLCSGGGPSLQDAPQAPGGRPPGSVTIVLADDSSQEETGEPLAKRIKVSDEGVLIVLSEEDSSGC